MCLPGPYSTHKLINLVVFCSSFSLKLNSSSTFSFSLSLSQSQSQFRLKVLLTYTFCWYRLDLLLLYILLKAQFTVVQPSTLSSFPFAYLSITSLSQHQDQHTKKTQKKREVIILLKKRKKIIIVTKCFDMRAQWNVNNFWYFCMFSLVSYYCCCQFCSPLIKRHLRILSVWRQIQNQENKCRRHFNHDFERAIKSRWNLKREGNRNRDVEISKNLFIAQIYI
jgi:hypothetical protein